MKIPPSDSQSLNDKTTVDLAPIRLVDINAPVAPPQPVPVPGPGLALTPTVYLTIEMPKHQKHLAIDKVPLRIGRASDCDMVLPYPGISRWHAEISLDALGR